MFRNTVVNLLVAHKHNVSIGMICRGPRQSLTSQDFCSVNGEALCLRTGAELIFAGPIDPSAS